MLKHLIPTFLLIVYSALLIKVMVFRDIPTIKIGHVMLRFGGGDANGTANLVPFKTILIYLHGGNGWFIASANLIGNILLLVPFGFLIPFVFQKITWKKSLVIAIATGLIIEGLQVLLQLGIFDIDDVILNGLGVMIGFWIFKGFRRMLY